MDTDERHSLIVLSVSICVHLWQYSSLPNSRCDATHFVGWAYSPTISPPAQKPRRPLREVERIETKIAVLEEELRDLELRLGDPEVLADRDAVAAAGERHRGVEQEIAWLLREWEEAAEAGT